VEFPPGERVGSTRFNRTNAAHLRKTDTRAQSDVRGLSWIPFSFMGSLRPPHPIHAAAHSLVRNFRINWRLATGDFSSWHARQYDHRDSRLFRPYTHLLDEIEPRRLSAFLQDGADVDQHAVAVDLNPGRQ